MYHDLLEQLKDFTDEQFGKFTRILIRYDKDGIIPEFDDLQLKLAFQMLKPNMDRNKEKYEETCEQRRIAGSLGGKQKAINLANATKCYQNLANLPNLADNDIENDIDIKKDIIKEKDLEKERLVDGYGFSAKVKDSISLWLQHKKEKRQTYQPTGLKQLLTKLKSLANEHGDDYVVDIINSSITNNYSGIFAKNKRVQNNAAYHHNESYTENYDEENRRNQLIDGCPF